MKQSERNLEIGVPRTKSQREFYKRWVKAWHIGKPVNIENEYGYLFDYMKQLIRKAKTERDLERLDVKILKLQIAYPVCNYRKSESFQHWALEYRSDAQMARGNYKHAIEILSEAYKLSIRPSIDKILSLKLHIGDDLSGWDLLYLNGIPRVTRWGRENLDILAESAGKILSDKRIELNSPILPLLRNAARLAGRVRALQPVELFYGVYQNVFGSSIKAKRFVVDVKEYPFRFVLPFSLSFVERCKLIENDARESCGLPKIGEGWISETDLYYTMKEKFPDIKVVSHASPKWLGRQHLDVFLTEIKVALEFQGEQHDKPIKYFGGEKAFLKTQERDARKLELCNANGVRLIYVRPGYSLKEVMKLIKRNTLI